ncbi:hypothetical protein Acr_00g0050810 [Actinidia rufa]|uniref:NADP-dependent oxidoreductase domain-containing protein n=1 Tax=Actinidia rufa TaxID=165716 RepID=A0A7J0DKL1_9ERIC|nr:hypothetical protein Acr_00g0050810 [Actinidia rufa]
MGATTGFTLGCAGQTIPAVGLGTILYPWVDAVTTRLAVLKSIKVGYRHFDYVFTYGSEHLVREAIADALHFSLAKSRDELFITTKLWCTFADGDHVVPAIKMSLK